MTSEIGPAYFLLVDDLEENLLSLEGLLRREGLVLLKARSGPEALELLLEYDVALAILDVQMPEMDGYELAELMRGTERTRRAPIIFLTAGAADRQRRFRGYEAGAVDFLNKPIEPDILRSKASVFFELYQQRHQISEAIQRFQAAVAIDPSETDAHFQLGRIALQQGRLKDALAQFQIVLDQDEKHHQSEILRELGALYNSARQFEDARQELARYVERRPYDPGGLYYYGQSLEGLGRFAEARDVYGRASESADTAPVYLRRAGAKWSRLAQKQIRKLSVAD